MAPNRRQSERLKTTTPPKTNTPSKGSKTTTPPMTNTSSKRLKTTTPPKTNTPSKRLKTTTPPKTNNPSKHLKTTTTPFPILRMGKDLQLKIAKNKNFVFSPCSIQLAMCLLAHGAEGSTLTELLTFSQVDTLDQLSSVASILVDTLIQPPVADPKKGPKLSFVGGVWVDDSSGLAPSFINCAENLYKVKAEAVDFNDQEKAQEVVNEVNKWAKESTAGLIKSVLPRLDPDTRLVLANALYFKGTWEVPFRKSYTEDDDFYLLGGKTIQVPFMSSGRSQYIRTFDDFKVLRLPYNKVDGKKAGLSMHIILPHERDGLWSLVDKVGSDPQFLEKYTTNNTKAVSVGEFMVPKFKMTCDFDASQFLKGVGLNSCFSEEEAEFDNMILNPKLEEPLYVSNVHHKSYIEIDEEGTEAAAVTRVQLCTGAPRNWKPPPIVLVDFVADHPFMFMIKDDRSGVVLFLGHVVNPLLK